MKNKNRFIFLEEWVVIDFLNSIEDYFSNSKYLELFIALALNKFCEKQFGCKCRIGLELQEKYQRDFPDYNKITLLELNDIILKNVEENTAVDVAIAKMPKNPERKDVNEGMNFQIKRFGKDKYKQNTESLINFLNDIRKKYVKTETQLAVLLETPEEIDLKLLQSSINTNNYPFEKIILLGLSENKYINFYGIWPESGWSRFNLENLNFDF